MSMAKFVRALGFKPKQSYEPKPRFLHHSGAVGGECLIFAGFTVDFKKIKDVSQILSTVEVFDQYLEQWRELTTTGSPPKGLFDGGYCVSPSGDLYVYGGLDGSNVRGGLYKLSSLKWSQLSGESDVNGPMKKNGCGMTFFDKNKVAVIGGYGPPPASLQDGASFIKDKRYTDGCGWNNDIHIFDTYECGWSSPTISGTRPPPTAAFTLTSIDEYRALMFGGGKLEGEDLQRINDLYLVDFRTMVITKLEGQEGEPWPVGRAYHAACCLGFGSKHPHLLVTGGLDKDNKVLGDAWLFDVTNRRWKELVVPDDVLLRRSHSVTAIFLISGLIEATIFGGVPHYPNQRMRAIAKTAVLTFEYSESTWQLVGVAKHDQLGTNERIREKIERIKRFARERPLSSDGGAEVQGLRDALNVLQTREREFHQQLEEANRRVERERERAEHEQQLNQQLQQEQRQLHHENQQLHQEKQLLQQDQEQLRQENQQLQQEQHRSRERVEYAEVRAREAEAQLYEVQSHWVIPRREIELTEEMLGQGAWGKVMVAKFRGTCVAAKCYYQILLSDHNLRLFHREITMAARLRHPSLVQFIGASMEGELILLTELMTTSLGDLMHHGPLSEANINSISLDVARALNYLHRMQPHPIIHRDICSGNVLLDPLPDNRWKAKVSDYGSVNLVQHLTTAHPGNPFYAPPESKDPDLQTPKMDIYSFGVLLAEMLTNELPEKKDRHRHILKISVERPNFIELVRQCLSEEGDHRPSAQEIITQLNA